MLGELSVDKLILTSWQGNGRVSQRGSALFCHSTAVDQVWEGGGELAYNAAVGAEQPQQCVKLVLGALGDEERSKASIKSPGF
jgi:hypothetical protein